MASPHGVFGATAADDDNATDNATVNPVTPVNPVNPTLNPTATPDTDTHAAPPPADPEAEAGADEEFAAYPSELELGTDGSDVSCAEARSCKGKEAR